MIVWVISCVPAKRFTQLHCNCFLEKKWNNNFLRNKEKKETENGM